MTDLGVPMMPDANATAGPEDALGTGAKRGDYSERVGGATYHPHSGSDAQRKYAEGTRSLVAAAVAAGADASTAVMTVTAAGVMDRVTYVPAADITGAATNNRKLSLVNGGADGDGTTEIAAISFGSGTDATAGEAVDLTLSSTPANLNVAAGDQLLWKSAKVGTGIADPGGTAYASIAVTAPS